MAEGTKDGVLGGAMLFVGLGPDAAEVGVALAEEGGAVDDGLDVGEGEAGLDFLVGFEALVVVAADEVVADELDEVGLAAGEVVDCGDGVGGVVDREVVVGVGDEALGGFFAEEADGDGGDVTEERAPVVVGHFLEAMESREGEDEPGVGVDEGAEVGEEVGAETVFSDVLFEEFKFVEGDDVAGLASVGVECFEEAIEGGVGVVVGEGGFAGFGEGGGGGEAVVEGEGEVVEEFAGAVDHADALEVEVDEGGVGAEVALEVLEDGGFAHAAVAVEEDGGELAAGHPEFFDAGEDVVASDEELAAGRGADEVGVEDGLTGHADRNVGGVD